MNPVTGRLREIIERAFDSKAEAYSNAELAKYFKRRELLPTLIHQREHHVVKGRKGTGKTAILLYLSLPVQVHCGASSEENFAGFYVTFGANFAPQLSFLPIREPEITSLFGHWFNLYTCKAITDSMATVGSEGLFKVDTEQESRFVNKLWTSFFEIADPAPSSFREMSKQLDSFQRELRRLLSATTTDRVTTVAEYCSKREKYVGRVTNIIEFPEIIEILQTTIQPLAKKVLFILLDEYDNLSEAQQTVLNTVIAGSTGQYYVKVGVLSGQGMKTRETVTGLTLRDDQLKVLDLEYFANAKDYADFIRAAIAARLVEIQRELSETPELSNLFGDLDKLIPAKSPSMQAQEQGYPVVKQSLVRTAKFDGYA